MQCVCSLCNLCFYLVFYSELITSFTWNVPKPFQISPVSGVMNPKSTFDLQATFCPTSAAVFKATAVCTYGENLKTTMNLDGIGLYVVVTFPFHQITFQMLLGKFPYLLVTSEADLVENNCDNQTVITFRDVKIHHTEKKDVYLHNVTNGI